MGKKQSRRSISVHGVTYNQLREYCARINLSMSDFLELRVAEFFSANKVVFTMPGTQPKPPGRPVPKPAPRPLVLRPTAPVSAPIATVPVEPAVTAPFAPPPPPAPAVPAPLPAPVVATTASNTGRPRPTPAAEVLKNRPAIAAGDHRGIQF